jgi:hypothetical protein
MTTAVLDFSSSGEMGFPLSSSFLVPKGYNPFIRNQSVMEMVGKSIAGVTSETEENFIFKTRRGKR